jgi:hypothetical protein
MRDGRAAANSDDDMADRAMADGPLGFASTHDALIEASLGETRRVACRGNAITTGARRRGIARSDNFIGKVGEGLAVTVLGG